MKCLEENALMQIGFLHGFQINSLQIKKDVWDRWKNIATSDVHAGDRHGWYRLTYMGGTDGHTVV